MTKAAIKIKYTDEKTKHSFKLPITVFIKPTNAKEYTKLEKLLDQLIDEVKSDGQHPLAVVMQIIGDNLEQYDNEQYAAIGDDISDIEFGRYFWWAG